MRIKIKNLSQFVDSKRRGSILLPDSLLRDGRFAGLPDEEKWALVELMLQGSRTGNPLRVDKINATLQAEGFIEEVADERDPGVDKRASRSIPDSVRVEVFARDMCRCKRCGRTDDLQLDHIVPHSKGGETTADNLQLLCGRCNRSKSNKHRGSF